MCFLSPVYAVTVLNFRDRSGTLETKHEYTAPEGHISTGPLFDQVSLIARNDCISSHQLNFTSRTLANLHKQLHLGRNPQQHFFLPERRKI